MNRIRTAIFALVLLGWGGPWAQAKPLASAQAVGEALRSASREILLVTPSIRSKDVAEGLRRAALERGVQIFIITDAALVAEPAGFIPSLSLLTNVHVRLLRGVTSTQAVLDRGSLISGPLLFDLPSPLEARPTDIKADARATNELTRWFTRSWNQARPYRFKAAQ